MQFDKVAAPGSLMQPFGEEEGQVILEPRVQETQTGRFSVGVGVNSDAGVRRMKGPSRPLIDEAERAETVLALEAVDAVTLFDEPTPRELIAEVLPDVLLKGADWSHFVAGREEVEAAGGRVLTIALEPGYSTTNLVERILSQS